MRVGRSNLLSWRFSPLLQVAELELLRCSRIVLRGHLRYWWHWLSVRPGPLWTSCRAVLPVPDLQQGPIEWPADYVGNAHLVQTPNLMWPFRRSRVRCSISKPITELSPLKGTPTPKIINTRVSLPTHIVQELCESRGGRPGLSVLTSILVSVDVKIYRTVLRHWSQLVPNMSTDIRGH